MQLIACAERKPLRHRLNALAVARTDQSRHVERAGRLTNRFFLKDRCALPDQMSFSLARSWRAFVLAKEDRRSANKNEITIFVFSITAKDFSHGVLLDGKGAIRRARRAPVRGRSAASAPRLPRAAT